MDNFIEDILSPTGSLQEHNVPRKRRTYRPRNTLGEDEVMATKRFLMVLEQFPCAWDRSKRRCTSKEWEMIAAMADLEVEQAKSVYDKVYRAIKYRVSKAKKDGRITDEMWKKDPENAFMILRTIQAYDYWNYVKYLTRHIVSHFLKVKFIKRFEISVQERRRLLIEVGLTMNEVRQQRQGVSTRRTRAQTNEENENGQNLVLLESLKTELPDEEFTSPVSASRWELWGPSPSQSQDHGTEPSDEEEAVRMDSQDSQSQEPVAEPGYNVNDHITMVHLKEEPVEEPQQESEDEEMDTDEPTMSSTSALEFYVNFKKAQEMERRRLEGDNGPFQGPLPTPSLLPKVPAKFNVPQAEFEHLCRTFDNFNLKMWEKMQSKKCLGEVFKLTMKMMMYLRSAKLVRFLKDRNFSDEDIMSALDEMNK